MSPDHARIEVRDGEVGDAGRLAEIWRDSWREAYVDILPASVLRDITRSRRMATWLARIMNRALTDRRDGVLLVGALDGHVVGLCEAGRVQVRLRPTQARREVAEVFTLYVDPAAQQRGVGGALLDVACEWAREFELERMVLWVLRDNEAARGFYRANGFSESGLQRVERMPGRPLSVRYGLALG